MTLATSTNHVSVHALDLEESARFYREVFGMETVPSSRCSVPVRRLRLGHQQLHLFQRPTAAPPFCQVGLSVADLEASYRRARALEAVAAGASFPRMSEQPDGSVQLSVRDPAGNLVRARRRLAIAPPVGAQ